jgi:hypothetical protein
VVCIKLKKLSKILLLITAGLFLINIFLAPNFVAKSNYDLEFDGEPTYKLMNEIVKGDKVIGWTYQIDIKIKNIGDERSDLTIVNITDQEGFTLQNSTTFEPGETKTISFVWSTLFDQNQKINVNYYPANLNIETTPSNSGKTKFTLVIGNKDAVPATSTPGFELIILLLSIIILIIISNRKKK